MNDKSLIVEIQDPKSIFIENKADELLEQVKKSVSSLVFDIKTIKGRKECASWAAKVARSKTIIDAAGKDLVSGWKAKSKKVDQQRKYLRDSLDKIKNDVRAPLNNWEQEQRLQQQRIENTINDLRNLAETSNKFGLPLSIKQLESRLETIEEPEKSYGEEAARMYAFARQNIESAIIIAKDREKKEKEARKAEQEAREKEIAKRIEREKAEAIENARIQAEREKAEAVEAERRKAREESARIQREQLQKELERQNEERLRLEVEKRKREEQEARERDLVHRTSVHSGIVESLKNQLDIEEDLAKKIVSFIDSGRIPGLSIKY